MAEIVQLRPEPEDTPDADCVLVDQYGRPMYRYIADYQYQGADWSVQLWAYDVADAEHRIEAMRHSLVYCGQLFSVIPA